MTRRKPHRHDAENERLARFLARHAVSEREAVEADVAPYRDASPSDSWRDQEALSQDAAFQLASQTDAIAIAVERDEPDPSYREAMRRLKAEFRERWRRPT